MPVNVIRAWNPVVFPRLPENFVIAQAALIEAHVKTDDFMRSIVDTAVDCFIKPVHKPVMTGAVHLNKLSLPRPFIARFMHLFFFGRPGPGRFYTGSTKNLPDHMIRNIKIVTKRKLLAEGSERRIDPMFLVEPDDLRTKLV